ncbi:MAG TPA: N-acetyltransferase [Ohtaekwangia sp.]|uniref:GNAT family N-acetyltransferase n=1 Tax=Ohtaekwangia sp. TaxID=2066019 RepID=UPI002F9264B0
MHIRTGAPDDLHRIIKLYKEVAKVKGGIARLEQEITEEYVQNFLSKSLASGLILVAIHPDDPDSLIGEMHAYKPGLHVFNHLFSDLTIAVHPDFQGRKVGRTLFTIFLEEVARHHTDIGKVELITREGNHRAIAFYQSLGFKIEGRMEMRIKTPEGIYEADIPMGWQNPNFEF